MIVYREANSDDLKKIALVHIDCFPKTMITLLGQRLISSYYGEFLREDNIFIIAESKDDIVGFCMGYESGSEAKSMFIKKNKIRLVIRLLYLCATCNKLAIRKCWNYLRPQKCEEKRIKKIADADLLSICVKDVCKGKGVAQQLVNNFENVLLEKHLVDYTLSVYKTNARAIKFYEKMGLEIISESDDEYKMYKKTKETL